MFAVPGWSLSVDTLKAETASPASGPAGSKSRKRKRNTAGAASENVTADNVADLYESVVEGKKVKNGGLKNENASKKAKKDKSAAKTQHADKQLLEKQDDQRAGKGSDISAKKDKEDKKQHNKGQDDASQPSESASIKKPAKDSKPDAAVAKIQPVVASAPKLTRLQASMREKLISARFRHLNETLYTRPSEEAFDLFQESPEMFDEYHEGFRRQVKVWPENPVDSFLRDIRARAKAKPPMKGKPGPPPSQRSKIALPRTIGTCTIADLGCGDARLAEDLQKDKSKLRVDVKSFDLQSPSSLVTKADIANLPLEDGSVNVAIFCLALMGTNWIDFVEEAYRIIHWKGELWIAEIKSRFGPQRSGGKSTGGVVDHSVGNRKKNNVAGKKGKGRDGAAGDPKAVEDLAVEVDGAEDRRRETDVTAFIEALKKRGFILQGERADAVDLSNKMFVKMHFIKGAAPTKGKGVKDEEKRQQKSGGGATKKRSFAPKWDEALEDEKTADKNEAAILKPCVYKIR